LPLGTRVSFKDDPHVYQIADYQTVLECSPDCDDDHDCFPEPHICVSYTVTMSKPLSQLGHIFGEDGFGHVPAPEEVTLDEAG
jgi:hypothetical protein